VLVGRDTLELSRDYTLTPYTRDVAAMSLLELQANMFDTLIQNRAVIKAPFWMDLLITALICILTLYVVLSVRPTQGLMILGTTLFIFVVAAWMILSFGGYWVGMAHPLIATFVCYYFFIPYRLIMENRKSWEYYQRNRLLTQVEELKSNFLRMMSHDLKTPLARIQGMAEVAMQDLTPLSPKQKAALETIGQSSEELSEFIGSILSLSRIESKEIKLDTKSRDVNLLLYDLVQRHEFLAKKKNIEIMCEFEPIFSMKVDEDLIRQVFSNLIENAIKYSPENSRILITTEEKDGQLVVQVADQGVGISKDELINVFTKFYRSPEHRNSEVGGSGLGLYLAKYFVELHRGSIEVESEPGQGSTFTVQLPMT
jgi:signal transduction histidine kinase